MPTAGFRQIGRARLASLVDYHRYSEFCPCCHTRAGRCSHDEQRRCDGSTVDRRCQFWPSKKQDALHCAPVPTSPSPAWQRQSPIAYDHHHHRLFTCLLLRELLPCTPLDHIFPAGAIWASTVICGDAVPITVEPHNRNLEQQRALGECQQTQFRALPFSPSALTAHSRHHPCAPHLVTGSGDTTDIVTSIRLQ